MQTVTLSVDPASAVPLSPLVYGSFLEHIPGCIDGGVLGPDGLRADVQALARQLGVKALRFPGGTVIGTYHWQDFVGPLEHRKKTANIVWGGRLDERFGTDEFLAYCRAVGAEPMLTVNMPSGTPEEAAHWVEYCNGTGDTYYANLRRQNGHPEPYRVRWWFIGNESYAAPDLGLQDDVRVYTRQALEYAKYMKMTDPALRLVAVGSETDDGWNRAVLERLGFAFDALSVHKYCQSEHADPFAQLRAFDRRLAELEALLAEASARPTGRDADGNSALWYRFPPRQGPLRLALDEWNIWNADDAGPANGYRLYPAYTWRDALWMGCFLNLLHRHAGTVALANQAQLVNVLAPIIAPPDGPARRQAIYYPFAAWASAGGTAALACTADAPAPDVSAVRTPRGVTVFAVNTQGAPLALALPAAARRVTQMQAGTPDSVCTAQCDAVRVAQTGGGREAVLPPYSITVLELDPAEIQMI